MEKNLEESSKDKFLFDTSAFLSLESANLLDTILETFSIITTFSVLQELKDFSQHEDKLGKIAKRVLNKKNKFLLKETSITEKLNHISETDKELFNLSLEENTQLITDDLKLLYHTTGKIERSFSTIFLTIFVSSEILTKKQALEKVELMRDLRNWKSNIIYLTTIKELEDLS